MRGYGSYRVLAALLVALLTSSLVLSGCGQQERPPAPAKKAAPVKIGVIGPMTFTQGKHMWNGAMMAAEEINGAGGIQVGSEKRLVEVVKVDSNEILNVPDASSAMERAITVDKVDFLVGGFRTEAVLGMQDVAMEHKKIFLSVGAAHPQITQRVKDNYSRYKYYFRVNPFNSTHLGRVMFLQLKDIADVVRKELGVEKPRVAVVAENAVWADPVIAAAEKQIPAMGMELAGVWRPSANATDVTAELTAVRAAKAHIIFAGLAGPVGGVFARQWQELEIPAVTAGVNVDAQGGQFWKTTGGKGNYLATVNFIGRVAASPKSIPFYDKFTATYNELPIYTGAAYDAILVLAEAIKKAGTLDPDALASGLEKTDFAGTAGRIVFTSDHDVTWGPGYLTGLGTQWQDGKLVVFWPNGWENMKYEGTQTYTLPPWVVKHWKR